MKNSLGQLFLEATKYQNMDKSNQEKGKPQPVLERPCEGRKIELPSIDLTEMDGSLNQLIIQRRSLRNYADKAMTFKQLAYLLFVTQGIKQKNEKVTLRTVPSAGARHAFDTYLLVNHVEGLESGLYRYLALEDAVVKISSDPTLKDTLTNACLGQKMIASSAVTFFWVADIERMTYRYGERGYRYLHLDAGHVCQNLYLSAEAIGAGTCAVGAFDDDRINSILGLNLDEQFTIYIAPVGFKKSNLEGE